MKKTGIVSTVLALILIFTVTTVMAQEKASLGAGNLVLKFDYINFTDSFFSTEGSGVYLGIEGYYGLSNNFYLGGEIGTAGNFTILGGEDIEFIPIELNTKYAMDVSTSFVFDVGGGLSYSRAELQQTNLFAANVDRGNTWLFGGQVFADLTYKIRWFTLGLNAKYQVTSDFKDSNFNLSNYRYGLSLGAVF